MPDSFDTVVFIRAMRKEYPHDGIFVERINGNRLRINPEDDIADICGYLVIYKPHHDIAVNPQHIVSIFSQGKL